MPAARILLHMTLIGLAGTALGAALNVASPHPVGLRAPIYAAAPSTSAVCHVAETTPLMRHRTMPIGEAIPACEACSVAFVDARGEAAFEQAHIPGALHLPPEEHLDAATVRAALTAFATIVVYDGEAGCELAQGVADRLVAEGFADVRILEGSWTAWEAAQGPAQTGACGACGERSGASR